MTENLQPWRPLIDAPRNPGTEILVRYVAYPDTTLHPYAWTEHLVTRTSGNRITHLSGMCWVSMLNRMNSIDARDYHRFEYREIPPKLLLAA